MDEVDRLSWDEVAARIAGGAAALLPIGAGAKQHGLHLPMGTDRVQAEWLTGQIVAHIDALIWPTLTYGCYPAFVAYSGSVSLSAPVFEASVREIVHGLIGYGARVIVLNTGISTIAPVERALAGLEANALHLRIHDGARHREIAARVALQSHGGHADELETSRMLALAPNLVAMSRAEPSPARPPGPGPMQRTDPSAPNYSRSGSIGDPRRATAEKGRALLEAMLGDALETIENWNR